MKKSLFILIFIVLFISGCSFSNFETSNLMHPPKATGEMAQIQSTIEKNVGKDIFFKYPQDGDFKSAIVMHDIDGDSQDEALAVYQLDVQDTQCYIMIIDKIDDDWQVAKTITVQNMDLYKVCFGDFNGDGKDDILLAWISYSNHGKKLTGIFLDDGDYKLFPFEGTYSDVFVEDFDNDARSEILTLSISKLEELQYDDGLNRPAKARLIKFNDGNKSFEIIGSAPMDSTAVKYNYFKFGKIDDRQIGAIIDANTDKEKTITEIVYWNKAEKSLKTPLYNAQTLSSSDFLRDSVIQATDINNDGIIELPKVDPLEGLNEKNIFISSWFKFNTRNSGSEYVDSCIVNGNDAYNFYIPEKWKNEPLGSYKIKVTYDYGLKTLRIFENIENVGQVVNNREFLNIIVISKKEYEELTNKDDYKVLHQENNKIYAAVCLAEASELAISKEEIKENFKVS